MQFVKTASSIKMKENKVWIQIPLIAGTERCFLKTATPKFQKCMEK